MRANDATTRGSTLPAAPAGGDEPLSPCVRNCCLDDADVCLGCGRHVDEITGWHGADGDTRREILERARVRRSRRTTR